MDLARWKLFRDVDSSLTSVCKFVKLVDDSKVGFLVLQNDDVYAVTDTPENLEWLGNGINYTGAGVNELSKVEALCGKGITNFDANARSFAAVAEGGCVYLWTSETDINPGADGMPRKVTFPDGSDIQANQVSYGACHTLCLTSQGQICGWGDDDKGQLGSGSKQGCGRDVTKIVGFNSSVVQVAAGNETSYALDSLGKVWSWGSCEKSSLGYKASDDQLTPKLIEGLPEIEKIAVGDSHVLALSIIGELYFWGKFDDECEVTIEPLLIKICKEGEEFEPVTDIASTSEARYAVCQTKDQVYFWGIWFQQYISMPIATKFSSMEEVFACGESPIMLQPVRAKAHPRIVVAWKRAFNDESTADVRFSVEKEVLYAHSAFLKFRSDYFRSMLASGWKESKRDSGAIEIHEFTFRVFKAFMYFLYNESLIESDMSVDDFTELMRAADYYGDEDLRLACEKKLKTLLTPENACLVYACAVKTNAEALQNYVLEFMVPVFKEVANSEECIKMDSELKSKLMIHIADLCVLQVPKKRRIR